MYENFATCNNNKNFYVFGGLGNQVSGRKRSHTHIYYIDWTEREQLIGAFERIGKWICAHLQTHTYKTWILIVILRFTAFSISHIKTHNFYAYTRIEACHDTYSLWARGYVTEQTSVRVRVIWLTMFYYYTMWLYLAAHSHAPLFICPYFGVKPPKYDAKKNIPIKSYMKPTSNNYN